jgi:hypothetical protein
MKIFEDKKAQERKEQDEKDDVIQVSFANQIPPAADTKQEQEPDSKDLTFRKSGKRGRKRKKKRPKITRDDTRDKRFSESAPSTLCSFQPIRSFRLSSLPLATNCVYEILHKMEVLPFPQKQINANFNLIWSSFLNLNVVRRHGKLSTDPYDERTKDWRNFKFFVHTDGVQISLLYAFYVPCLTEAEKKQAQQQ